MLWANPGANEFLEVLEEPIGVGIRRGFERSIRGKIEAADQAQTLPEKVSIYRMVPGRGRMDVAHMEM
jgi:hypothetical protein